MTRLFSVRLFFAEDNELNQSWSVKLLKSIARDHRPWGCEEVTSVQSARHSASCCIPVARLGICACRGMAWRKVVRRPAARLWHPGLGQERVGTVTRGCWLQPFTFPLPRFLFYSQGRLRQEPAMKFSSAIIRFQSRSLSCGC